MIISMKKFYKYLAPSLLLFLSSFAVAEPTSPALSITQIRPYGGGNIVFVYTTGSFCPQSFYSIDLGSNSGKAMYAAALTALASGKLVLLEIAGSCGGGSSGSTLLQSLYILQ